MPSIVYKPVVSATNKPDKKYFGISETPFKDQNRNHMRDFRHREHVNRANAFNNMEYNVR